MAFNWDRRVFILWTRSLPEPGGRGIGGGMVEEGVVCDWLVELVEGGAVVKLVGEVEDGVWLSEEAMMLRAIWS